MIKSNLSLESLKKAADKSRECLSEVSDPKTLAFLNTFATRFDPT